MLIQGTCERINYKTRKIKRLPKEQWIVVENHHEPIIEPEYFSKISSLRKQRRLVEPNHLGQGKAHLFTGKLYCSSCGSFMVKSGHVKKQPQDWYLRCSLANKSRNQKCTSHNIRLLEVQKTVENEIEQLFKPNTFPGLTHQIIGDFIDKIEILKKDTENIQTVRIHWNI